MRKLLVVGSTVALAGCFGGVDLSGNAFAGNWDCNGTPLAMTGTTIDLAGDRRRIAFIETGGNADYGITMTDGTRYSVFDTQRRSLTFVAHADRETLSCTRAS